MLNYAGVIFAGLKGEAQVQMYIVLFNRFLYQ